MPSQSLSRKSAISSVGSPGVQLSTTCPFTQLEVIRKHAPWPQVISGKPSSTIPSQSSSRPLQISSPGSVLETQISAPAMHCRVPSRQTPCSWAIVQA